MRTGVFGRISGYSFWGLVLLLLLSPLAGCGILGLGGSQTSVSGTVMGQSATAREAGRVVPAPVRGASVTCAGATTSTGANGTFGLDVPASSSLTCSVSAPGYVTFKDTLSSASSASGGTLSLNFSALKGGACAASGHSAFTCPALRLAPGMLTGVVTNPQTDAVARTTHVECWDLDQATWVNGEPPQGVTATTGQDGRYILTLPVDPYGCLANDDNPLYHVTVAPATTTTANMSLCAPQCPAFSYHSGVVMHSYTAYVIFWLPPGAALEPGSHDARFESLVQRYFHDVGGTSFFAILTQYWDKNGPISGAAALGGTYVDTTPYPHKGTSADPLYDSDIHDTIVRDIQAKGWINDATHEFFVITGYGIQECQSASQNASCTYTGGQSGYCGYHGPFGAFDQDAAYAYIADNADCAGLPSFALYPSPNHDTVADGELSTISHEMFEAITDPNNGGWYDDSPYTGEMGDKCVNDFGSIHTDGSNVTLSGDPYILQAEWSDTTDSCTFSYTPTP